jgi:1-acyl-sn-glycerol-3-phosphate acyltransferase
MVTKRELFRVPLWGRAMQLAGFVAVDRDNHDSALRSMDHAAKALRDGTDIWIAPEGTRSRDGELGPFRKGGFHLALSCGARILPVTLVGTRDVLPAKGRHVQSGVRVVVTVHPPISSDASSESELDTLMHDVRLAIAGPLAADA